MLRAELNKRDSAEYTNSIFVNLTKFFNKFSAVCIPNIYRWVGAPLST